MNRGDKEGTRRKMRGRKKEEKKKGEVALKDKAAYLPSFLSSSLVFVSISLSTKAGGGLLIPELVFLQSTSKMITS